MSDPTVVVLQGDQTGQELLVEALRTLAPDVIGFPITFQFFDLSLEKRRATRNQIVLQAAEALKRGVPRGLGLKAATITPEAPDDVGSPNAILRQAIGAQVILRVGRRIPGVRPVGGVYAPIAIVRMAVDDAYNAQEWRENVNGDEVAFRTEKISRRICRAVAEFAFQYARKTHAKVFGGPKFTVSPIYEGLFKEELDRAAARYPDVRYEPQLIDATYALLLKTSGDAMVIPTLNRDGDCMSDLVLGLFGSIAGAESLVLALDEAYQVKTVMAEAPHGTAPTLFGKNVANPMAMILAGAALLTYFGDERADRASRALYEACLEAVYDGIATPDVGGHATTTEFTDEVIARTQKKLAVWDTLG